MTAEQAEPIPIWEATLDNHTWVARVHGIESNDYRGTLTVTRVSDDKEILREEVGLAFGAMFGPDVSDVNLWGQMVVGVVDQYYAQHPEEEEPPVDDR
jgi:hypothetical protein